MLYGSCPMRPSSPMKYCSISFFSLTRTRYRSLDFRSDIPRCGRPVVLIAGGRAKGGDYGELSEVMKAHVAGVVVLGEAAPLLAEAWRDTGLPMEHAGSDLDEAVRLAYEMARVERRPVLFSPGCASFDMFQDFEDRGDRFREIVGRLGEGA